MQWIHDLLTRYPHLTDIHITEGFPAYIREHGFMTRLTDNAASWITDLENTLTDAKKKECQSRGACDSALFAGDRRCRLHFYRTGGKKAAALRILPSIEYLPGDPDQTWMTYISNLQTGLALITGPTGSGKSTTLAHILHQINHCRPCHILTIEEPVEYVFPSQCALIHQKEVGTDVHSFSEGMRDALREDPDIIVIGEMRDTATISAALTAAETGHLVLATMHNKSAADAALRIIHAFPGEKEQEIRSIFASVLRTIGAQKLYPIHGKLKLMREILTNTPAISHLIREGKDSQLTAYMEMGNHYMRTMKQEADRIAREEQLTYDEAEHIKYMM